MLKKLIIILNILLCFSIPQAISSDDLDNLFKIPGIKGSINTELKNAQPFLVKKEYKDKKAIFNFTLAKGAYLYKDAFKVSGSNIQASISFNKNAEILSDELGEKEVFFGNLNVTVNIINAPNGGILYLTYQGCDAQGICYPKAKENIAIDVVENNIALLSSAPPQKSLFSNLDQNLLLTLFLSFILGISLDLTPCVLPMLAIFSTMITGSKHKSFSNTLILNLCYLLGLCLTYTILGFVFAHFGLAAQAFLQHPYVIMALCAIFIYFSLDCMEVIKLKLPSHFNNFLTKKLSNQEQGKISSAFIFGLISALLSTPCTSAPLAGALLYVMQSGNILNGSLLFLFIGLGMGLPLVFIGVFGQRYLPRVGRFSVIIRRLMAIALLAMAYYISLHLLGNYKHLVLCLLIAFCCSYILFSLFNVTNKKTNLKFLSTLCVGLTAFVLSFYLIESSERIPPGFTLIKKPQELSICKDKPCLITFSAQWCSNCHSLDKNIYGSEEFSLKARKSKIITLRVDMTKPDTKHNKEFTKLFNLIGVPTYVLLDSKGQFVKSDIGIFEKESLFEAISNL